MRQGACPLIPLAFACLFAVHAGRAEPLEDALPSRPSPEEVLRAAFRNRYELDTVSKIELVMRNSTGSSRRRLFDTVSKRIDGRLRSIGRLIEPDHLRGMTIMTIEVPGKSEDTFIYLPSLRKVRRVSSSQRADSFLGSDLTYEDFERRRVSDFELEAMAADRFEGEPVWRIRARPRRPQSYAHLDFYVARADGAILATRYYKEGASDPFRTLDSPRSGMVEEGGHVLPLRLVARNVLRGTRTEITISDLVVNPPLDERLFTLTTLQSQRPLR
jgi:hypothetical protein